ncbi:ROK family transcriptional regulator [Inconstantimicrobium mannanitabidum]|uniref:Transcriptional regulator n=1 Tax=Inconstantimicrobium mannanitabidum TaxID=1604901 RepID=A0ACB5RGI8_9CLOT|nr:ROK family transcriptional regulator [Clostridium sp. TW13]GKX68182.1 transcriptional regulator [Clostridium sp. TW13]
MDEILKELSDRELGILNIIQKKGSITKKDLQIAADVKLTTLNRAMKILADNNLIVEVGTCESTGGRKAVEYSAAEKGIYVIGIDISRTYVKLILSNLRMDILKNEQFSLDHTFSPEKTVNEICILIKKFLLELSIDKTEVLGIGIGTVGPMDRGNGIILNPKGFFHSGWANVPLKEMIESELSIPCFIDNGANTAILAEYSIGKGRGLKNVVYIHCGVGIRSAVITDGSIIRAINDSEDAFAHMVVDIDGDDCGCGNQGCIESYVSLKAIAKRSKLKREQFISSNEKENNYNESLNSEQLDNEITKEIINKSAEVLGVGIGNLARILNPQLIILSGPLIMNYDLFYPRAVEVFHKNNCMNNQVEFSKGGELKESVIAIGSCLMVINHYLKN